MPSNPLFARVRRPLRLHRIFPHPMNTFPTSHSRSSLHAVDAPPRTGPSTFVRQGEWLFVPAEETDAAPLVIHWCAPLACPAGGTPHVVAELARGLGVLVWHHPQHAVGGIAEARFTALPERVRRDHGWTQRVRVTDARCVLARGAVRHPDHAPIHLGRWHRVLASTANVR
jgi:hypothetical protein